MDQGQDGQVKAGSLALKPQGVWDVGIGFAYSLPHITEKVWPVAPAPRRLGNKGHEAAKGTFCLMRLEMAYREKCLWRAEEEESNKNNWVWDTRGIWAPLQLHVHLLSLGFRLARKKTTLVWSHTSVPAQPNARANWPCLLANVMGWLVDWARS